MKGPNDTSSCKFNKIGAILWLWKVSVHFNNFSCMGICDTLIRHLSMLTYIYFNVMDNGL